MMGMSRLELRAPALEDRIGDDRDRTGRGALLEGQGWFGAVRAKRHGGGLPFVVPYQRTVVLVH